MQNVLILDFGSQYTQLIARRVREMNVYCEIWPCTDSYEKILNFVPRAIILSGGPASVLQKGSPVLDPRVYQMDIPLLGICYGMQLMSRDLGGRVVRAQTREYGHAVLQIKKNHPLLDGVDSSSSVWMSHGDSIESLPPNFELLATSEKGVPAIMARERDGFYALQFHPEVHHTQFGKTILRNFLFGMARITADWNMSDFITESCDKIRQTVGKERVILGLSGGVDSSVAAVLIHKAIGNHLTGIFINNGLLRHREEHSVREMFRRHLGLKLVYVDASRQFLKALKGVKDPERKRKIIGKIFIDVFQREAKRIKGATFLAQGTLYPDVIESVSFKGPSAVIKSHHNVGGLPKKMGLKLLEPLRELFKDEVRELGRQMQMPPEVLGRHPFPGPGLAIRILGNITEERLRLAKLADKIFLEEIKSQGWYDKIWQAFAVILPVRSVGVMGDERTYENTCALRAVDSVDGMTAHWVDLPHDVLTSISNRIINEVKGINRVVYDISSKPPATIEWE